MVGKLSASAKTFSGDWKKIIIAICKLIRIHYGFNKFAVIVFYGSSIVTSIILIINSYLNSYVIDTLIDLIRLNTLEMSRIYWLLTIYLIMAVITESINSLRELAQIRLWTVIGRDMTAKVISKIAYLDFEFFTLPKTNNLIIQVLRKGDDSTYNVVGTINYILGSIVGIIAPILIISSVNIYIPLIVIITSIPRTIVAVKYGRIKWGIWSTNGDLGRDYDYTMDYLKNYKNLSETKVFNLRNYLLKRMNGLYNEFLLKEAYYNDLSIKYGFLCKLISILGLIYSLYLIINLSLNGVITIGETVFYLSLVNTLAIATSGFFQNVNVLYEKGLFIVDMHRLFELKNKIKDGTAKLHYSKAPQIEIKNLKFSYPETNINAIDGLSFNIKSGEKLAIVGENGSGKTTLISLLLRFYDPSNGDIIINGTNLKSLKLGSWYDHVATLFQNFNTYHFDVKTNIGVGNINKFNNKFSENIEQAAKKGGSHKFIEDLPKKYETVLSNRFKQGSELSVGQWQKVALSRAHFRDASLIILDEPTSAIDPKSEAEIFDTLFKEAANKTVIIVSHRFSTIRHADRIIVMDKGKIIEEGSHETLMKIENGVYKHAFNLQKRGFE